MNNATVKDLTGKKNDISKLVYELTYHKYLMKKDKTQNLFKELTIQEYITLHSISRLASDQNDLTERIYLKDLAEQLEKSIHNVSKMARALKDRGFVIWSHDGNGSEGTYISITKSGMESMYRQEELLKDYYSRIIDKFGLDNMIHLLEQIERLEEIMENEFACKGELTDEFDTTE